MATGKMNGKREAVWPSDVPRPMLPYSPAIKAAAGSSSPAKSPLIAKPAFLPKPRSILKVPISATSSNARGAIS